MNYITHYASPLGGLLLASDGAGLTGAWFEGQKYFGRGLEEAREQDDLPVFCETRRWLELYFAGRIPGFLPALHPAGTPFQRAVWELLLTIPYGKTVTYGELARRLGEQAGCRKTSARAVGSAVGRNPISVLVPCHRVIGADGSLTGYAGGLARKTALLKLERTLVL